ncbi:MAG: hypothetical protein O3A51_06475, partial [Verrucomicrobia bacterium]|nr:hypothetical protein [Verrucomicrobiota bacterium]
MRRATGRALCAAPHPRLYITADAVNRVRESTAYPALVSIQSAVRRHANVVRKESALHYPRETHNALLVRAREVQSRVLALLVAWCQTVRDAYREAIWRDVVSIAKWEYWSWIAMRRGDTRVDAEFDLSCGENSATLAIAYDHLFPTLSPAEKRLFVQTARRRSFRPFLKLNDCAKPCWWYGHPAHNWNTVCAGGVGMLALAMLEDAPEAAPVLALVEASFKPYMLHLDETGGAWPEGVGYWNYGMCYAYRYLLSHENAMGQPHPLLHRAGTRKTVDYPLMLSPHGQTCGFGDANQWQPLGFHYALAARLKRFDLIDPMDAILNNRPRRAPPRIQSLGGDAELLWLHPRRSDPRCRSRQGVAVRYP